MSQRQYVSLPSLFHTTIRTLASGTHEVLESIEMEDDELERRRSLLKLLVWAQATLQKVLLLAQWCRKRPFFYKSAITSEASLISYDNAWAMTASQISQHKTAMAYPVWDLHTSVHVNALSGYYLLPQFCRGGVLTPISKETATNCRRRLQCQILTSLLSTHPPSHVRIVRCENGHVTLDSVSGYTVNLSLRMAPANPKDGNESELHRINWTLMSLEFNLITEELAFVVSPRQSAFVTHQESLRLMESDSFSSAFHGLISRVDRLCCHVRFKIIKRQAQEAATQNNRLQADSTKLTYWFWPDSALRIHIRQPTLRYLIVSRGETAPLPVPISNAISFDAIVDLAISTESTRLRSMAENCSSLRIDVDRLTGKLLVPSSVSADDCVHCDIQDLPAVLKKNDDELELYTVALMMRCSGADILAVHYSDRSIRIRLNGRRIDLCVESGGNGIDISYTINGSRICNHFDALDRCKQVEKFIVHLQNSPLSTI